MARPEPILRSIPFNTPVAASCRLKHLTLLDTTAMTLPLHPHFFSLYLHIIHRTRGGWQQFNLHPLNDILFFFLRCAHLGLSFSPSSRRPCSLARHVVHVK